MTTSETPLSSTARTTPTRKPQRYETDRAALHAVLDATLVCHVGLVKDGRPLVVPTAHARAGDTVFLHGSTGSGNVRAAAAGVDLCLTATVLDGIVYARSLNDHSMNYRSAVVYGRATPITDDDRKVHALRVLSERLSPGSWDYAHPEPPRTRRHPGARTRPDRGVGEDSHRRTLARRTRPRRDVRLGGRSAGTHGLRRPRDRELRPRRRRTTRARAGPRRRRRHHLTGRTVRLPS